MAAMTSGNFVALLDPAMEALMKQLYDNALLTQQNIFMGIIKRDEMQDLFDLLDEKRDG